VDRSSESATKPIEAQGVGTKRRSTASNVPKKREHIAKIPNTTTVKYKLRINPALFIKVDEA
jgi:hypothetical protein